MSKKIIAVSLALLIMVVGFVGCGKKDIITINGEEYYVMTDDNGDAVINDKNQAAALVTDSSGETVTYENGEPQTYLVKIFDTYEQGEYAYGEHYKLPIIKGWSISGLNKIVKDGTDGKTYIEFVFVKELEKVDEKYPTIDECLAETDDYNQQIADAFADEKVMENLIKENPEFAMYKGCKIELGKSNTMIKGRNYTVRTTEIVNESGTTIHYAESCYFIDSGALYSVNFVSQENVEKIEFQKYLQDFVFIP